MNNCCVNKRSSKSSFVCTFKFFYTLLIPDDADWITSEILYIYLNKCY